MSATTRAYWFIPYRMRETQVIEEWFEAQAKQGWVAERLVWLSAIRLVLQRRDDRPTYRYAIDPRTYPDAEEDALLTSAGWEDIGPLAGKDVWRVPYEGERPDFLYAD
ncbi:hypothetical protein [Mumia zhuanghuii]|uniref:DUF2812 domain-containing protein n=1 Tax=Mumia zhuanghuii TaxID=2585211 RepID=A0A5C4MP13_9ACTN|nr:hypothetical protein [Mumia zhuanghuii]TNC47559.1 hypothetical protein FHE65_09615 [Mumia zhuanghuii]TNC50267.1 hypothetical protein FHE65_04145 [Mumia zhuanghuii]